MGESMPVIGALDRGMANRRPERAFVAPDAIVDEVLLTSGEKLAALERWRLNIRNDATGATDTLRQIEEAKRRIRAMRGRILRAS
jgi:hypothetical protein